MKFWSHKPSRTCRRPRPWPLILSFRGLVHALAGRPEQALVLIEEAIGLGGPHEEVSPEFRVLKGDFLRMLPQPDLAGAEEAYLTAIRGANTGGRHLIELQALTRLVGLRRQIGHSPDGSDELASLYATFSEGFEEYDLVMARQVLG